MTWRSASNDAMAPEDPPPTCGRTDLWPAVRQITCPTLIVRGGDTDTLTTEVAQQMKETFAQGQVAEVPRAGHMIFEDNPEDFIAAVKSFLR